MKIQLIYMYLWYINMFYLYIYVCVCNYDLLLFQQGLNTDSGCTTKAANFDGMSEYVIQFNFLFALKHIA